MRNDFIKRYFQYRSDAIHATLLGAINERYNNRKIGMLGRPEALDTALDGTCVRTMNQIIKQTQKDASNSTILIERDFNTKRDVLWMALAASTLNLNDYSVEVRSSINGNRLKQLAFEGAHKGLIFTNDEFASLIGNLCSGDHQLPTSPNATYQSLIGAEAVLAMAMYQRFLVNPDAVDDLFTLNAKELNAQQKTFAESAIRNERSHRLLATSLVPIEMLRTQDRLLAKVALTDDEADAYSDAGNDHDKKAGVVKSARARILEENRSKVRDAADELGLTDDEADLLIRYPEPRHEEYRAGVVKSAQERLLREAASVEAERLLKRTQAREAENVAFTDDEADKYAIAEVDAKPGIVELAKERIAQEEAALLLEREKAREIAGVALTDDEADLYLTGEKEAALQAAVSMVK